MKSELFRLSVIIIGVSVLASCQRAQPVAATLDLRPPQGQFTMLQLGKDQGLYCLTSTLDSTRLDRRSRTTYVRYTLWRIPLDGAQSDPVATFDPGCDGIVSAGIVTAGSQIYLWYRCMGVDWEAIVLSGRGDTPFREIGRVGTPHCRWIAGSDGQMTVVTDASHPEGMPTFRISHWNADGAIDSGTVWTPEVPDTLIGLWRGTRGWDEAMRLPNGNWLCLRRSPVGSGAQLLEMEEHGWPASPPKNWIVYWVLDPVGRHLVGHGARLLADAAFGSIPCEEGCPTVSEVWQDAEGTGVLIVGGDSRLYLLQWDNEGNLMAPPESGRSALRLTPADEVENPVGRALSTLGRASRGQTDFRIWEIDRTGRIGYRDFRR